MEQNNKAFDPSDKEQLRDFINDVITERFSQYQKSQERMIVPIV
jgi:hypothetical protein